MEAAVAQPGGWAEKLARMKAERQHNPTASQPPAGKQTPSETWAQKLRARKDQANASQTNSMATAQSLPDDLVNAPEIGELLTGQMYDFDRIQSEGLEAFNTRNAELAKLRGTIGWSRDDADVVKQIAATYPDAEFIQGPDGATYARFGGMTAVLNRKGISPVDLQRFTRDAAVIGIPSAMTAGAGGWAMGGLGRLLGAGAGAAGGSLQTDVNAEFAGGEPNLDFNRAAITGAFGVGGEAAGALVSRFGPALWGKFKDLIGKGQFVRNGKPTPDAIAAFREAGIEADQITLELLDAFRTNAGAADRGAAARAADASTLPEPVPLTTGQLTQNPATMGMESAAKRGAFGEELAARGMQVQEGQQSAMMRNAETIRGRISGNADAMTVRGQGGQTAQAELAASREAARQEFKHSFELAKKGSAGISANAVSGFRTDLGRKLRADFDLDALPIAQRLLLQLTPPANARGINLGALENWRRRVSMARRSAAKGTATNSATEAAALGRMLGAYDEAISGTLSDAILYGSADDIVRWRDAISKRREFANRFETVPIIDKLTRTEIQGGQRALKVDPADAAAEIFGRGLLGMRKGLVRDLRNLKSELSSASWNAIRDEAVLNLFSAADGTFKAGTEFAKRWELSVRQAGDALGILFTPQERNLLGQLARVSKTIERAPRIAGDMNPSGTGAMNSLINLAGRTGGSVGEFGTAWLRSAFNGTQRQMKIAETSRYFAGVLDRRTITRPRAFQAIGVQAERERERQ